MFLARTGQPVAPSPDERGSGLISTTFGVAAFLGFLLFGTHLALGLSARSQAGALGFDATRRLAQAGPGCGPDGGEAARGQLRAALHGRWRSVTVDTTCGAEAVTLRVDARKPKGLLPATVRAALQSDGFTRSWTVRTEAVR